MPRIGQVAVALLTATLACAGGAAAISNVTGVSPMVLIRPASATTAQVLTVANTNSSGVPDIAAAVARPDTQESATTTVELPSPTARPSDGATPSAPAVVQPRASASTSASSPARPTPSPATSSGSSSHSDADGNSGTDGGNWSAYQEGGTDGGNWSAYQEGGTDGGNWSAYQEAGRDD